MGLMSKWAQLFHDSGHVAEKTSPVNAMDSASIPTSVDLSPADRSQPDRTTRDTAIDPDSRIRFPDGETSASVVTENRASDAKTTASVHFNRVAIPHRGSSTANDADDTSQVSPDTGHAFFRTSILQLGCCNMRRRRALLAAGIKTVADLALASIPQLAGTMKLGTRGRSALSRIASAVRLALLFENMRPIDALLLISVYRKSRESIASES
ncbi:MAG: hypothetical protein AAFP90_24470, partial [Planctomycetota bacterium]